MGTIHVNSIKCDLCGQCVKICPFGAIEITKNGAEINAACKMCRLCIKKCPQKAIAIVDEERARVNKEEWKGIMVFVEHLEGEIHPVTLELIGKARELAGKINHPVYAVFMGHDISARAGDLPAYGVDRVYLYDYEQLKHYKVDVYANTFEDCIRKVKPSVVLIGATSIGRSLAPRLSTRFRTGLTADCTMLDIRENTDLVQIRPAFGGNIMAQIITQNSRPQFATVRYKVMNQAECLENPKGTVEKCYMDAGRLDSRIRVLNIKKKEKEPGIADAQVLVVAGRGIKEKKDMVLIEELAGLLGGQVAVTRGLVEDGWAHYTKQIGLSGRTVKPKLIITCGVSGAVQFTAGMNGSENIFAINRDKNAPIFKIAHYGMVGDLYEVIPELMARIKEGRSEICNIKR
ncbi:MAG: Electron transfer flavoprotein, alpha subunit [Candidatus Uhrbacteria bacterium GW2011_GWD2_52_7]|uniref:Electron transfer flavoprotein, alpha subunit n=1 Tax=Candidatus Uhrbacteria bacterium GW2011_GWD2_52_7 TaxID=1618989 RepID=A0A0G1XBG7_9BACT|nr:MAG: Electron transfer flavoprotein, alpha subunit [Candidatus Uhrbacteria bacterium GW2011_GWD2_52_7]